MVSVKIIDVGNTKMRFQEKNIICHHGYLGTKIMAHVLSSYSCAFRSFFSVSDLAFELKKNEKIDIIHGSRL